MVFMIFQLKNLAGDVVFVFGPANLGVPGIDWSNSTIRYGNGNAEPLTIWNNAKGETLAASERVKAALHF